MNREQSDPTPRAAKPVADVNAQTSRIQRELEVAGAELHLTNTVLDRSLPDNAKQGDVGRALEQNTEIEEKVQAAAQDLKVVTQLLHEEEAQTARLSQELADRPPQRD
ncbi:MAG: hypothetical protein AB7I35_04510 [Ramlibacter sp.]